MPQTVDTGTVDFQLGDDYLDIRPLAKGGMGSLFRAYRRGLGVDVVIKRMDSQFVGALDQKSEANILKRIKHRYLPRIYDMIRRDDGYFYTVMDYIPGINMEQYVQQNGPADQKQAHKWACQLCEVAAYLHEQEPPIIHCDIKPSNLMITPGGDICLIDFNASLILKEEALAVGATAGYAAPEQYSRSEAGGTPARTSRLEPTWVLPQTEKLPEQSLPEKTAALPATAVLPTRSASYGWIGKSTDVYGIGATLYYLVSGHVPEHALQPLTPLDSYPLKISDTFCAVIRRAMEKDQSRRFSDAAEMLRALQDVDRMDARFRRCRTVRRVSYGVLGVLFALSLASTGYGVLLLRAERDNSYLTLVSQGETLAQQGDTQGAYDLLEQAIEAFPNRADAYLSLAARLYQQGSYQEAYDLIQNALAAGNLQLDALPAAQAGDLLYLQANCAYEQQDYPQAVELYSRALQYRQDNHAYDRGLALAQARSGDLDGARQTLEKLQNSGADALDCEIVMAEIYTVQGDADQALAQYRKVLADAQDIPTLSRAYLAAADLCRQTGDLAGRIELLRQAVDRLGDDGALQEEALAQALTEQAQQDETDRTALYEEAAAHLEHVISLGQGNVLTELNLAVVLENLGQFQQAQTRLLALQDTNPTDYRVYMRLAFLYADWQAEYPVSDRDYSAVAENYRLARQYYEQAMANGTSDMEMTRLEQLMEQLRVSGWVA